MQDTTSDDDAIHAQDHSSTAQLEDGVLHVPQLPGPFTDQELDALQKQIEHQQQLPWYAL